MSNFQSAFHGARTFHLRNDNSSELQVGPQQQREQNTGSQAATHNDDSMSLDWTLNMRRKCFRFFSSPKLMHNDKHQDGTTFGQQDSSSTLYANIAAMRINNHNEHTRLKRGNQEPPELRASARTRQVISVDDICELKHGQKSRAGGGGGQQQQQQVPRRQVEWPPTQIGRRSLRESPSIEKAISRNGNCDKRMNLEDELILDDRRRNNKFNGDHQPPPLALNFATPASKQPINSKEVSAGSSLESQRMNGHTRKELAAATCQSDNLSALSASSSLLSQLLNSSLNQLIEIDNGSSASPSCEGDQVDERDLLITRPPPAKLQLATTREASAAACLRWMRAQQTTSGECPVTRSHDGCDSIAARRRPSSDRLPMRPPVDCGAVARCPRAEGLSMKSSSSLAVAAGSISGTSQRSHYSDSESYSSGSYRRQAESARRRSRCRPRYQQQPELLMQQVSFAGATTTNERHSIGQQQQFVTFERANNELRAAASAGHTISHQHLMMLANNKNNTATTTTRFSQTPQVEHTTEAGPGPERPTPKLECCSSCPPEPLIDGINYYEFSENGGGCANANATAIGATMTNGHQQPTQLQQHDSLLEVSQGNKMHPPNLAASDGFAQECCDFQCCPICLTSLELPDDEEAARMAGRHDEQPDKVPSLASDSGRATLIGAPFVTPTSPSSGTAAGARPDLVSNLSGAIQRRNSSSNGTSNSNGCHNSNRSKAQLSISSLEQSASPSSSRHSNSSAASSASSSTSSCAVRVTATDSSEDSSDQGRLKAAALQQIQSSFCEPEAHMGSPASLLSGRGTQEAASGEEASNLEKNQQAALASDAKINEQPTQRATETTSKEEQELDWLLNGAYADIKSQLKSPKSPISYLNNNNYESIDNNNNRQSNTNHLNNFLVLPLTGIAAQGAAASGPARQQQEPTVDFRPIFGLDPRDLNLAAAAATLNARRNHLHQEDLDGDTVSMVEATAKLARVVASSSGSNSSVSSSASSLAKRFQKPPSSFRPISHRTRLGCVEPIYDVPSISIQNSPSNPMAVRCLSPDQKYPNASRLRSATAAAVAKELNPAETNICSLQQVGCLLEGATDEGGKWAANGQMSGASDRGQQIKWSPAGEQLGSELARAAQSSRYDKCKCAQCSELRALKLYLSASKTPTTVMPSAAARRNTSDDGRRRLLSSSRRPTHHRGPQSSGLSVASRVAVDGSELAGEFRRRTRKRLLRRGARRRNRRRSRHRSSCCGGSCCSSCCSQPSSTSLHHNHANGFIKTSRVRMRRGGGIRSIRGWRRNGSSISATTNGTCSCCCSSSSGNDSRTAGSSSLCSSCVSSCCSSSSQEGSSQATTGAESGSLTQEYLRRHRGGRRLRMRLRRLYRRQHHNSRSKLLRRQQEVARRYKRRKATTVDHDDELAAHSHGRHARRTTRRHANNGTRSSGRSMHLSGRYQVATCGDSTGGGGHKLPWRLINDGHATSGGPQQVATDGDRVPLVLFEPNGRRLDGDGDSSSESGPILNQGQSSGRRRNSQRRQQPIDELDRSFSLAVHDLRRTEVGGTYRRLANDDEDGNDLGAGDLNAAGQLQRQQLIGNAASSRSTAGDSPNVVAASGQTSGQPPTDEEKVRGASELAPEAAAAATADDGHLAAQLADGCQQPIGGTSTGRGLQQPEDRHRQADGVSADRQRSAKRRPLEQGSGEHHSQHRNNLTQTTCRGSSSGLSLAASGQFHQSSERSNYRHHHIDQRRHHHHRHERLAHDLPSSQRRAIGRHHHHRRSGHNRRRLRRHGHHQHGHHTHKRRSTKDWSHQHKRHNRSHNGKRHSSGLPGCSQMCSRQQHPCHCGIQRPTATAASLPKGFLGGVLGGINAAGDYVIVGDSGLGELAGLGRQQQERENSNKKKLSKLKQRHHLATGLLLRRANKQRVAAGGSQCSGISISGKQQEVAGRIKQLDLTKRRHLLMMENTAAGGYPSCQLNGSLEEEELGQHYADRMLLKMSKRRQRDLGLFRAQNRIDAGAGNPPKSMRRRSGLLRMKRSHEKGNRSGGSSLSLRTSLCSSNLLTLGRSKRGGSATLNQLRSMQRAFDESTHNNRRHGRRWLLGDGGASANERPLMESGQVAGHTSRHLDCNQTQPLMDKFLVKTFKPELAREAEVSRSRLFGWQSTRRCQCSHCCLVEKLILMDVEAKKRRKLLRRRHRQQQQENDEKD